MPLWTEKRVEIKAATERYKMWFIQNTNGTDVTAGL
jgi:hypothetical protein